MVHVRSAGRPSPAAALRRPTTAERRVSSQPGVLSRALPSARPRAILPHPGRGAGVGLTTFDAQGPGHPLPSDRPPAPPAGRAQRPGHPDRRRGLRRLQRLRRPVPDPQPRAARRRRAEVHPLPHHCALLAHPLGPADGAQPPLGGHGRHHRVRHLRAGQQLDLAQHRRAACQGPAAERLLHGPVRQVPRGAGLGGHPHGALPPVAHRDGLRALPTASSGARPTSATPDSTRALPRSSRTDRPRRATTSTTT